MIAATTGGETSGAGTAATGAEITVVIEDADIAAIEGTASGTIIAGGITAITGVTGATATTVGVIADPFR